MINGGFDSVDKFIDASLSDNKDAFLSIKGVGEETALSIINAFKDKNFMKTLYALRDAGLHFSLSMDKKDDENLEQIFAGQVWCVTGSFENYNPRSKALEEIEKRGGRTVSSVTSKTTHLLSGKGGGSKRADAMKYGVKIVDENEFISMLGKKVEKKEEDQQGYFF